MINGTSNHIHLFIGMKPNWCLSDFVREVRKSSDSFVNNIRLTPFKFQWQEGFGAFLYSHSQIPDVINYIENLKIHHKKRTFKEEFLEFGNNSMWNTERNSCLIGLKTIRIISLNNELSSHNQTRDSRNLIANACTFHFITTFELFFKTINGSMR